jgi:hypothetical protein
MPGGAGNCVAGHLSHGVDVHVDESARTVHQSGYGATYSTM